MTTTKDSLGTDSLGRYLRSKQQFHRAARVYARAFADFNDGAADELALARAESALDEAAVLCVRRADDHNSTSPHQDHEHAPATRS